MQKFTLFLSIVVLISNLEAKTLTATRTYVCCQDKDNVGKVTNTMAKLINEKQILAAYNYMSANKCDVIIKDDKFIVSESTFSLVKAVRLDNGKSAWCPRELEMEAKK
ncbi:MULTISPECIES: hypothetical protein [unclassified Campylobacter]|uniref:hypothetical protein n=1 Tax=unclassified Campylobacter TaxID=2593542 RepID=UPI0022E9E6C5|nr:MULTISPECIES: hypothetical protein [unclassified Campylobacter]MDA3053870.1 hypothetical protein [Campylobacter sp. VBCF_07 NA4]MDA3060241.1 hypothetical protein [Campylobacter sp. VBCF_02 NA5]MDA3069757.1 hypothetical protein [Campylobacter sp. VBCF_08 NA3]WBR54913.1 hypothetical protein PF027_03310 [Campylobacter sp. VBCF_01 NA2]